MNYAHSQQTMCQIDGNRVSCVQFPYKIREMKSKSWDIRRFRSTNRFLQSLLVQIATRDDCITKCMEAASFVKSHGLKAAVAEILNQVASHFREPCSLKLAATFNSKSS